MAGVGGGYRVGLIAEIAGSEVAFEDGSGGGLTADDGGVDAFAGERVDEAGSVADEEDAAMGNVGVAAHAELLAGDVGESGDAELLLGIVEEQSAGDLPEVRVLGSNLIRGWSCGRRRGTWIFGWGEGAYAEVDVVGLGEEPAVAAGERGEVEDEVVRGGAIGEGCREVGVGDGGFEREAVVLHGRREGFAVAVLTLHSAGLAVGAVGADEDGGAESFEAKGGGDVQLDGIGELADGDDAADLAQLDTAALACGEERLLEAEVVEALAHGHGADGIAGLHSDVGVGGVGAALLEDNLVADALDDGVDGVAEGFEGLAGEAAGAGFVAREAALVEQDDVLAGLCEVIGGGAASGSCPGDEDVNFANHCLVGV